MPADFTLPPDTRAVGSGNPPIDMDGVVDTINAMGGQYNILNAAYSGGADPTGAASSSAAINAAITAAKAAPDGAAVVTFPPGIFTINAALLCGGGSPGGLVLQGSGWATQLKLANAANCYIFDLGSAGSPQHTSGLTIRDMYLNCNGTNQTSGSGGIYARGAVWTLFDHLWIDVPQEAGIRFFQDGLGGFGHHNTVRACLISSNGGGFTNQYGVWMQSSDENMIVNNTIQDIGNPATQTYPTGIRDEAGLQTISGNQVVTGTGIYSGGSGGRTRITNNILDGSYSGSGQIYAGNNGVIIASNQCYNIGFNQPSSGTADGIFLDNTDHLLVTGNLCTPLASTVARSGINLSGTVASSLVQSNTIMPLAGGSFTNSIVIGSTPTGTQIGHNIGYNPVGKITSPPAVPASSGGATTVTNSTGVDVTVFIVGGTGVTAIYISGNVTGYTLASGATGNFRLPASATCALTYTGAPTWTWFGD